MFSSSVICVHRWTSSFAEIIYHLSSHCHTSHSFRNVYKIYLRHDPAICTKDLACQQNDSISIHPKALFLRGSFQFNRASFAISSYVTRCIILERRWILLDSLQLMETGLSKCHTWTNTSTNIFMTTRNKAEYVLIWTIVMLIRNCKCVESIKPLVLL